MLLKIDLQFFGGRGASSGGGGSNSATGTGYGGGGKQLGLAGQTYFENGNKVSLKELLMNNGKLFSNTIPEDSILVNNTKYQIGHISSDINCKLPSTGSEIELTFGTLDPPYNLYCENCLSFTTSRNTYYHIVFYYDKTLGAWYPKVY